MASETPESEQAKPVKESEKSACAKNKLWTEEEDKKLREAIKFFDTGKSDYGSVEWQFVANIVDTCRSAKSCRLRWENQLKPNIDHTPFRPEEDQLILRCQSDGNKWSEMASMLTEAAKAKLQEQGKLSNKALHCTPHRRTDNQVKNRWHSTLAKVSAKQKAAGIKPGTERFAPSLSREIQQQLQQREDQATGASAKRKFAGDTSPGSQRSSHAVLHLEHPGHTARQPYARQGRYIPECMPRRPEASGERRQWAACMPRPQHPQEGSGPQPSREMTAALRFNEESPTALPLKYARHTPTASRRCLDPHGMPYCIPGMPALPRLKPEEERVLADFNLALDTYPCPPEQPDFPAHHCDPMPAHRGVADPMTPTRRPSLGRHIHQDGHLPPVVPTPGGPFVPADSASTHSTVFPGESLGSPEVPFDLMDDLLSPNGFLDLDAFGSPALHPPPQPREAYSLPFEEQRPSGLHCETMPLQTIRSCDSAASMMLAGSPVPSLPPAAYSGNPFDYKVGNLLQGRP